MKYEAILQRLLTDYGLYPNLEIAEDFEVQATREKVETIKQELTTLGPVNPGTIEEFKEVAQRHGFLTEQRNDLLEAKKCASQEAMTEMDDEMTIRFSSHISMQCKTVSVKFSKRCSVAGMRIWSLHEPDNLLETGVKSLHVRLEKTAELESIIWR